MDLATRRVRSGCPSAGPFTESTSLMRTHVVAAVTVTVTVAALVAAAPTPVRAQAPGAAGTGTWWEVAVGTGGSRLTCRTCEPERELGATLSAGLGAYASPQLRVGLDGSAWTNEDEGTRESVYRAGLVAQLHPRPGSGLHLVAGLGWSGYRAGALTYDAPRLTLGAGWDLPLTASWVAGNRVTLDASSFASIRNDGTPVARSVGLSVLQIAVYVRKR